MYVLISFFTVHTHIYIYIYIYLFKYVYTYIHMHCLGNAKLLNDGSV